MNHYYMGDDGFLCEDYCLSEVVFERLQHNALESVESARVDLTVLFKFTAAIDNLFVLGQHLFKDDAAHNSLSIIARGSFV